MKTYQPHQQRVIEEKAALDENTLKLHTFIRGDVFKTLTSDEQDLLRRQLNTQRDLRAILGERIALFVPEEDPQQELPETGVIVVTAGTLIDPASSTGTTGEQAIDLEQRREALKGDYTDHDSDAPLIREDGSDDEFIIAHGELMEEMLAEDAAKAEEE